MSVIASKREVYMNDLWEVMCHVKFDRLTRLLRMGSFAASSGGGTGRLLPRRVTSAAASES